MCAHSRDNSRRTGKLQGKQFDQLVNAIMSKDAEEAMAELEEVRNHNTQSDESEDSIKLAA